MREMSTIAVGIDKHFRCGSVVVPVLQRLTLAVSAAELTLIGGPSGCGKSTLLAILSGLLRPDRGQVHSLGSALGLLTDEALDRFRLQHTGFVFQGFNLFPALTALEQVMLPLHYLGVGARDARVRAQQTLAEVRLDGRESMRPQQLSGGEKQRVAIARALAKRPRLLFADEPTSALDSANGEIVIELLQGIARRRGTTVVCVSHDPRIAAHADRVLHMEDGRIHEAAAARPSRIAACVRKEAFA